MATAVSRILYIRLDPGRLLIGRHSLRRDTVSQGPPGRPSIVTWAKVWAPPLVRRVGFAL